MNNRSLLFKTALFFSGVAVMATFSFNSKPSYQEQTPNTYYDNTLSESRRPREVIVDFREVAKQAIPAVVSIQVQGKKKRSSFFEDSDNPAELFESPFWEFFNIPRRESRQPLVGQASGVIVSSDGYILTNSHVVNEMDVIRVQMHDGREFSAKLLGQDTNMDLALIKIDAQNLPFLRLGDSDKLEVGQWVAAIGNPFGLQATLTSGVVSAKGRNNLDIVRHEDFIQTDAPINRGNSGGPLVTTDGEIVGINTAIATNMSSGYMGVGFAIPSNMARYVMDEVISNGKVSRGFLGVSLQPIDYNLAQSFDLKKVEGALVTSVLKGSPADKAGIKTEDIILKYDNRPVDNAATLRNAVYMMRPGTKIALSVLRQGQMIQVPIEVGQFTEEKELADEETTQPNRLGLEVDNLNSELAQSAGYTNEKGVIVTRVQSGSPASFAGFKKGILILAVNHKPIETKEQFYAAVRETPKGRPILFQLKQGNQTMFLSLQVD